METLRVETTTSHADEITLLRSRYDKTVLRVKSEALEHEGLAVENAVARTRQEYEERLSQQLARSKLKCEEVMAEAMDMLDREKKPLEEELERIKLQANEIPILKELLEAHAGNEKELHSEVARLQISFDSVSAIHQELVRELQAKNTELSVELQNARETSGKLSDRNGSLEVEVWHRYIAAKRETLTPYES